MSSNSDDDIPSQQNGRSGRAIEMSVSKSRELISHRQDDTATPSLRPNGDIHHSSHEPLGNRTQNYDTTSPPVEESLEARLDRLGRQRPDAFSSIYAEIGFVFSISMSQVLSVSGPY